MQLGQTADQRKSQPGATGLTIVAIVDPGKGFEDAIDVFFRDAGTIVRHDQLEIASGIAFGRDIYPTAGRVGQFSSAV